MVIIDEIHNFVQDAKNRIGLARIALNLSASRIGLTATPIWNGSKDFSEIIDLLQPDAMLENDVSKALKIQGKLSKLCFELYSESDDFSNTELLEEVASELGVEIEDICLDSAENRVKLAQRMIGLSPFSSWLTRTTAREVNSSRKRIIHEPILVDLNEEAGTSFWNQDTEELEETPSEKNVYNQIRDLLRHSSHRLQLDSMPSSFSNHIDCIKSKLNLSEQELQSIEELSNYLKELPRGGSKCNQIVKLVENSLQEEDCKGIVIFTHWQPTFATLKTALNRNESKLGFKLYSCNPKLDSENSEAIINKFQSHPGDEVPVILLTDKFKEGIDLFRANYMIHVDVPKNPLMVEQRIGRIDRLGQLSDTIHIFYVLLNQSNEHEYLEILKQRLEDFVSYFGIANPILPDDIGWKGKISSETIDLIKGKDFDSMANLSIEDKVMTKLCEEFEKEHTDLLRKEYSKLANELFQDLLASKPEQKEKSLLFPLKRETWGNFRELFAEGDNRLLGEAGKKGILDRNVNPKTRQFRLRTDNYGMPTNPDIRRRCVQLLMENQPA